MIVAGYTRISVDLDEDSRDNTSIENQKKIIRDYVAEKFPTADLRLYEDRDRSGYTFAQREDYQLLRSRLLSGEISVLVVKDFSRFSRRNSLGLLELETLRDAGVRIISIGDGIDYPTRDDWMLIQLKFLMNEMPVTDTSKKIKQLIANKQQSGKWVCAVPYGYRLINTKEMTYEVDPPAAEVVREIFELYNSGWGYKAIANHLTDRGIPTPRANEIAYREANGQKTKLKSKNIWSIPSISGILTNDFYIGTLRQHKYTRDKINGADKATDEAEQIVIENAHTSIVEASTFAYAQEQLKLRSRSNYRGVRKYPCDYSGFLFCGDCGAPMFSRSSANLKPSYICGTYMRQSLKGCTTHHIRVDKLDEVLKRYIVRVRENSSGMLAELEDAVRQQPEREQEIGQAIDNLDRQLENAREQLKTLYKRKMLDTMGKDADQAAIVEETYQELETELLQRIKSLEVQIKDSIDSRNQLIQVNRRARTVMEVFDHILNKPKLDKRDVGLLVERIDVYDDRLDIRLKADVDELLGLSSDGSTEALPDSISQRAEHGTKTLAVNVVSEGDPLEIFTEKDGEVIFKKYSPMGELGSFAAQICESLHKTTGATAVICDRDTVISVAGGNRRELMEKRISAALEQIMENRGVYREEGAACIPVTEDSEICVSIAAPIISAGDVMGCVVFVTEKGGASHGETEQKLAQMVAGFLGKQMEE